MVAEPLPDAVAVSGATELVGYDAPSALISNGSDSAKIWGRMYILKNGIERKRVVTHVSVVQGVCQLNSVSVCRFLVGLLNSNSLRTIKVIFDSDARRRLLVRIVVTATNREHT